MITPVPGGRAYMSANVLRALARRLRELGHDPVEMAQTAGVSSDALRDPSVLVPLRAVLQMFEDAGRAAGDPILGLQIASTAEAGDYGVMGFILASHPTIGEALDDVANVIDTLVPGLKLRARDLGAEIRLELSPTDQIRDFGLLAQFVLGGVVFRASAAVGRRVVPSVLDLAMPHPGADEAARAARLLGVAPHFDADIWAVTLSSEDLVRPVPSADSALVLHLHEAVETQIARRRAAEGNLDKLLRLGNCVVDLGRSTVFKGKQQLSLTTKERELLLFLHQRRNQTVSRDDVEEAVWGLSRNVVSHAPAVAIRRLRHKIEDDPSDPVNLVTVFGEGWRLNVPE